MESDGPHLEYEGPQLEREGPHLESDGPHLEYEGPQLEREGPHLEWEETHLEWERSHEIALLLGGEHLVLHQRIECRVAEHVQLQRNLIGEKIENEVRHGHATVR